ncbi:DUF554 domain-containing protein [Paenibacillus sp. OV219]|uniref:DUF554 domain-containing protein n=1 Tax=Paenibacillus sp. OV219 TaxID=1884377 RepID=UPI0008B0891C|nr:DUF554 domain-containing protein [Paenibacillus sp. OV219]SEO04777.1 hypothetical protein SAMN05518847_105344 [Paenibacillus sp. OV219]
MILTGAVINAAAIIGGGALGIVLPRVKEEMKKTVMAGLGMLVFVLGIGMALKSDNFVLVAFSLAIGGIVGEWLAIEHRLQQLGDRLQQLVSKDKHSNIAEGFVTTTLVFCIGAMAVLGSIESGLHNNHNILFTKSILDGFLALLFASTLGVGVLFSSVPILLYEGFLSLLASVITTWVGQSILDAMIVEVTSIGGILIMGIGINILNVMRIKVANLLPAIVIGALLVPILRWFGG